VLSSVSAAPASESSSCRRLLDVLEAESAALCGNRERIEATCAALRDLREQLADPALAARLPNLARGASSRVGVVNAPIVALICEIAETLPDPWPLLDGLLDSQDGRVIADALGTLVRLATANPSLVDDRVLDGLAARADGDSGRFNDQATLETIAKLLRAAPPDDTARIEALYTGGGEARVRRLAARLLDLSPSPPPTDLAVRILGREMAMWLAPYLAWTRATHLDLLALASGAPAATLASLRRAQEICGAKLLRELIGEIGWPHLNFGLTIRRFAGVSIAGSFPLLLDPAEEVLLAEVPEKRRLFDRFGVVAHGGEARETASPQDAAIGRFRAFNLAHADLLASFLDVTPLTVETVRTTVDRMDSIVDNFQLLFSSYSDECPTLAAVYRDLRQSIERALAMESAEPGKPLSAELTRLVGMFEDPTTLAAVRTLHGLKRYLHQRGLKLGMHLAESGRSANRTVTLALATPEHVLQTTRAVEYVDFESAGADDGAPPYAVQLVVEEFGRQLVHTQQPLPKVKVFCYGNEVHYFIAYRNHPAFVRIDYSPPGRGGMIDLAYFGVSKYELDAHPDPSLPAIERFFRRLDFDVSIENTHVHARYDKEHAFDLADLCGKAASLFRLAPYLMEVDWVIGDLALSAGARGEVAAAWSDFFAEWGVLPYQQFLTSDRCGILVGVESQAAGEHELRWNASDPYRDRFFAGKPDGFWDRVRAAVERRALRHVMPFEGNGPATQLLFEEGILRPLREACARGEVVFPALQPQDPERYQRRHPAECLVGVLQSDAQTIGRSARLADVVAMLARGLRFRTTGAINGYDIQHASLPLTGERLGLYVLRDASGIFRLALYAPGDSLHVRRDDVAGVWQENWSVDAEPLVGLLRRANYPAPWPGVWASSPDAAVRPVPGDSATETDPRSDSARIIDLFRSENPHASLPPLPGERILSGVAASPGRAVGPARLGLTNRHPADVDSAIVVCPSMTPADGAFLVRSAGVVSSGGGALSHAGLLALQYEKPALIVAGTWQHAGANPSAFAYRTVHYDERRREIGGYRVSERHHLRERDECLHDGDLVVLDADEGLLRILGQEPQALALHESLRQLAAASQQLVAAASDSEILIERGRRLRARHQLEKVLGRIADPILARHAVTELMLRDFAADLSVPLAEKRQLLAVLLGNPIAGDIAREAVHLVVGTLTRRLAADADQAFRLIPDSGDAWEILSLRLDVLRLAALVAATRALVSASGITVAAVERSPEEEFDALVAQRLQTVRTQVLDAAGGVAAIADVARLRHLLDELDRLDLVLGTDVTGRAEVACLRNRVTVHDQAVQRQIDGRRIVDASAGGIELRSVAGNKAANLAQVARLGEGALVPPWFVVTDCAFREAFHSPVVDAAAPSSKTFTVRAAVESALARADATNAQKASLIRQAWDAAQLPDDLVRELTQAYRRLAHGSLSTEPRLSASSDLERAPAESQCSVSGVGRAEESATDDADLPFVAVRSSASEEDVETATRAGEFDTFLFVRGEDSLITHVKRAWSGLWSERALHNRIVLGAGGEVGGGIIVQKMVSSRASGVLHTVNVAERRLREMVINAGLGLGEGIVSGAVAADRIVVSKEGDLQGGELHFRYLTADKRERVLFNSRLGSGTARVETLYHQRLRPALEYVEICELVRAAARLETAYGYPLDIEFAVEGTALFLLQVRPIPTPFAVWRDTVERWPLPGGCSVVGARCSEGTGPNTEHRSPTTDLRPPTTDHRPPTITERGLK
jgi:hypothetical protein